MMKVADFKIDTYKLICQAICILHHPSINFDPVIMSMVFTTTFFGFHRLITEKILTLPRGFSSWGDYAKSFNTISA